MRSADIRLQAQGLVEVENGEEKWFDNARLGKGMIGDDHVPVSVISAGLTTVLGTRCECSPRHKQPISKGLAHAQGG
jgi:hypothetical protein